jgi:hypothetical protein
MVLGGAFWNLQHENVRLTVVGDDDGGTVIQPAVELYPHPQTGALMWRGMVPSLPEGGVRPVYVFEKHA